MKTHIKHTQMRKLILLLLLFTGMVNAQIVNIPDVNFKNALIHSTPILPGDPNELLIGVGVISGNYVSIDANQDGEIQYSEAALIDAIYLSAYNLNITDLTGIEAFINIRNLDSSNNQINNLNTALLPSSLLALSSVNCNLSTLDISVFPNLQALDCSQNSLTSLNVSNLTDLFYLGCGDNNLNSIDLSGLINLETLYCRNNQFSSIDLNNLTNLRTIDCSLNSGLSALLNINSAINLLDINTNTCQLNSLLLNSLTNLKFLDCSNNQITGFDVSQSTNLLTLNCSTNQISNLDISNLTNLTILNCDQNNLSSIDVTNNSALTNLNCNNNSISTLDVSSLTNLLRLECNNNNLTDLNVSNLINLTALACNNNPINSFDLSNQTKLSELYASGTLISSIDLSQMGIDNLPGIMNIYYLGCPNLTYINIKNNRSLFLQTAFSPNLVFICADEVNISTVQAQLLVSGNSNVQVNSYCSFVPGGNYNTIGGTIIFDSDNSGCDNNDPLQPNIRVNINDGTNTGASFTNTNGNYTFYSQAGSFDITPEIENPTWFTFTPTNATIPFADNNNNIATQDFCIAANGVHHDLEIIIAPIMAARPGFDAEYQITYSNKGNSNFDTGEISLTFNEAVLDFVITSVAPLTQNSGVINWQFSNLLPFETRTINVIFNVNSPVETPAVNIGDELSFIVNCYPSYFEENLLNNQFAYNQIVVGSLDPNDITCLEGNNVAPSEIGEYLHYVINFENTGNYPAENVVVKTIVDTTKFDINSLQLLNTSNPVDARITGNVVEFIFENIQLGGPGGHGHVLLKIKSKNTLVTGDEVAKSAGIYFDYNAPVDTGMATTVYQSLSNAIFEKDDSINVSPNPTNSKININCNNNNVKKIELYDVQGRILETQIGEIKTIDISEKANGIYFLKITTEKGSKVEKVLKE